MTIGGSTSGALKSDQVFVLLFHASKMVNEITLFAWAMIHLEDRPIAMIIAIPLAYRLGLSVLLRVISGMQSDTQWALFLTSMWGLAVCLAAEAAEAMVLCAFLAGGANDSIRKQIQDRVGANVDTKVAGRLLAFPLTLLSLNTAAFAMYFVVLPAVLFGGCRGRFERSDFVRKLPWASVDRLSVLLRIACFVHAAQYFFYAYVVWQAFPENWLRYLGPCLLVGWIGYIFGNLLYRKIDLTQPMVVLATGHLVAAAALVALSVNVTPITVLICFFLTGLGGGSCYVIEQLGFAKTRDYPLFDSIGTVVGIGGCLVLVGLGVSISLHTALSAGLCLVVAVAALMSAGTRPRRQS